MTKPHLVKLRIRQEQLKRVQGTADAAALQARLNWEAAWVEYLNAMREEGLCANCEKPLSECQCEVYASSAEPTSALQARFTCEGKHCHRSFVIKYQPGAKIMGASCVCGHYTEFKEPAVRTVEPKARLEDYGPVVEESAPISEKAWNDLKPRDNHPCAHEGCTALIGRGAVYCEDHEPAAVNCPNCGEPKRIYTDSIIYDKACKCPL